MAVQLPPNGTGTVIGTVTISGKDYQQVLLSDGVTPVAASVNAIGSNVSLRVNELAVSAAPVDGTKATYSAAVTAQAPTAAATTDIFMLIGSATKTVKVTSLRISGQIATTAIYVEYQLFKRSTADTGGTATTLTAVPLDSANAAATAVASTFASTGPTVGTPVGQIAAVRVSLPITGTVSVNQPIVLIGPGGPSQVVTLRGVAQCLCINCNTKTFGTAPLFDIDLTWTEE